MKIEDMIRRVQRELGVGVDGKAGPETWGAIYRHVVKPDAEPRVAFTGRNDRASDRSEQAIATLSPAVRPYARALYFKAQENGLRIEVLSGYRTYEEQDALYAKGRRGRAGERVVTNARPGHSSHNFGFAFDIGVFDGRRYLPESPKYRTVGALGQELGLAWGGNWRSFPDQPHFELAPAWAAGMGNRDMLAECRRRKSAGEDPGTWYA